MRSLFTKHAKTEGYAAELAEWFVNASPKVRRGQEGNWSIEIGIGFKIHTYQWRLIGAKSIIVTSEDDGHQFDLLAPIDAEAKANQALAGERIGSIELDGLTGDLTMRLGEALGLQIITWSSGYESWQLYRDGEFLGAVGNEGLR